MEAPPELDGTGAAAPLLGESFAGRPNGKGGDDLTRSCKRIERTDDLSLEKNKKTCNAGGEMIESLNYGDVHLDSNKGVSIALELSEAVASNLSQNVVSLALCNGHTVLFACSGIGIEREGHVTRFLTSASLVKVFNDRKKYHDNLKVEVRHGGNVTVGYLGQYNLDCGIASVHVKAFPDVSILRLDGVMEFLPRSKVVSVGRDISGELMMTSGILTGDSSGSEYREKLMLSTCKISEVLEGGPLFDFDGNFVGMNVHLAAEGAFFLPKSRLIDQLACFKSPGRIKFPVPVKCLKAVRVGGRLAVSRDVLNKDQHWDPDSLGYPKPPSSMLNGDMVLVNTFEDTFGDTCGGVWSELSETVSSNIKENVVALASFNGDTRFFACTGFFIDWDGCTTILTSACLVRKEDKIDETLRIDVLLPNKERRVGTLQHCNLHYNVALVDVKDFHARHPANIQHQDHNHSCNLVAVGFGFEEGILMATKGRYIPSPVTLDCKVLGYSTCKITKAGIGGPLVEFDGKFVGMNFFSKKVGTPFLFYTEILQVLEYFKTKGSAVKVDGAVNLKKLEWIMPKDNCVFHNRWPVPEPYWCHPDEADMVKEETRIGWICGMPVYI